MPHSPSQPQISVLIATYNYGRTLGRALESVFQQTLPPSEYEILLVDDGSTDETPSVAEQFESRLRYFRRSHRGLPETCNFGIQESRAPYLVRVDSDDTIAPVFLERELSAFRTHPEAGFIFSDRFDVVDGKRHLISLSTNRLIDCIAVGIMFRTRDLKALGGYRSFFWEEYDLFLRFFDRFPHAQPFHIPEPLYHYWRHSSSMVSDPQRRLEGWRVMLQEWGYDKLQCLGSLDDIDRAAKQLSKSEEPQ